MVALRSVFAMAYLGDDDLLRDIGFENGADTLARQRGAAGAKHPANIPGPDTQGSASVTALIDAVDAVREVEQARQRASGDDK